MHVLRRLHNRCLGIAAAAAVLVAAQVLASAAGKDYYLTQLTMAAYYAVVVMGLSLVMGYAGQVSLGHGAFFAIGGYTSAVCTTKAIPAGLCGARWVAWLKGAGVLGARPDLYGNQIVTITPWAAFALALALAFAVAVVIGYPALRLRGHYLAMATLGFGLIVYRVVLGAEFTGASDGITGVPAWELLPGVVISGRKPFRVQNYYVAWALALGVLWFLLNVVGSRVGRALRALHESEPAANAMGVNTAAYKLRAFALSAVLAAAAGCFFTHFTGGIGPSEAGAMKSVRHVAMVAAGGMANLWGVAVVSTVINFLSLRGCFGTFDHAVFGFILIAIISLAPDGTFRSLRESLRRAAARAARRGGGGSHA